MPWYDLRRCGVDNDADVRRCSTLYDRAVTWKGGCRGLSSGGRGARLLTLLVCVQWEWNVRTITCVCACASDSRQRRLRLPPSNNRGVDDTVTHGVYSGGQGGTGGPATTSDCRQANRQLACRASGSGSQCLAHLRGRWTASVTAVSVMNAAYSSTTHSLSDVKMGTWRTLMAAFQRRGQARM